MQIFKAFYFLMQKVFFLFRAPIICIVIVSIVPLSLTSDQAG